MNRIENLFLELGKRREKALIAYITAGDPDLTTTERIMRSLEDAGVDILEVGVPFSDPTADGPTIQAASKRALDNHVTLEKVIAMIARFRAASPIPIILFGYYNPILSYGPGRFARRAKEAGIDGILVVDLPLEEAWELRKYTDRRGIHFINLIAPTTGDERIQRITAAAKGFLYYVSVTGITGTIKPDTGAIAEDMMRIRRYSNLPVAVGFGISTASQAAEIGCHAEGVVVGSAFVRLIEQHAGQRNLVSTIYRFAAEIKRSLKGIP